MYDKLRRLGYVGTVVDLHREGVVPPICSDNPVDAALIYNSLVIWRADFLRERAGMEQGVR
jgi:hypothetical protein